VGTLTTFEVIGLPHVLQLQGERADKPINDEGFAVPQIIIESESPKSVIVFSPKVLFIRW